MILWVNKERTVLVRWYADNSIKVCTRDHPSAIWGPPVALEMER